MSLALLVLAAGQGSRMHSTLPKVLQPLAGRSLLSHALETSDNLHFEQKLIVCGHQADVLKRNFVHRHDVSWVTQTERLGTGHAVQQAVSHLKKVTAVVVWYGDVPLISAGSLARLIEETPAHALGMMTMALENPYGLGRIRRDALGKIVGIVEEKDANDAERIIKEIWVGVMILPRAWLCEQLSQLSCQNKQGEYYLTDLIGMAARDGLPIHSTQPLQAWEAQGINTKAQLAEVERAYQFAQAQALMAQGVTLLDPHRFDLRGRLTVGRDVVIDANVIIEGDVFIGDHTRIGPNVVLKDVTLANHVHIKAFSIIEGGQIAEGCEIGPYARIRPGTRLGASVRIGNFVEVKKSEIGTKSKINHLSYVGDASVGANVNIGAGTITCNYDGLNKHTTIIEDDVSVGSNCQLIAPVRIGQSATIGAGTTLYKNAPAGQLTINPLEQRSIADWVPPKERNEESD